MSDMHDAWFFIGIFVFIFLIWIATGGPLHPLAFTGPSLAQPQELGGGTYLQFPRAAYGIGHSKVSLPGSSNGSSVTSNTTLPTLQGIPLGAPSPYRTLVSMNPYVSNASSSNPNTEYVQISVAQNAGIFITVSNWQLVSEATGKAARIPGGSATPTSGIVNPEQNIVLAPGENAFIVSGRSPIGTSFRENKCTGYFSTFQQFSPSLSQRCPDPSDELVSFYEGYSARDAACIDYVHTLSRCQTVLSPPQNLSTTCRRFVLQYLNYNGCVIAHQSDADFAGNTWRIYLGRLKHLWNSQHEIVKLLDANAKTVDAFSY